MCFVFYVSISRDEMFNRECAIVEATTIVHPPSSTATFRAGCGVRVDTAEEEHRDRDDNLHNMTSHIIRTRTHVHPRRRHDHATSWTFRVEMIWREPERYSYLMIPRGITRHLAKHCGEVINKPRYNIMPPIWKYPALHLVRHTT